MESLLVLYEASAAGSDGYPRAWHQTIKHLVREQAGNRCVRCGHPYRNGEHGTGEWSPCDAACSHFGPLRLNGIVTAKTNLTAAECIADGLQVEAAWRILTVHHLDGDKLNCRWWNLAALCQRCHLSIQGRVKLHVPYLFEHSDWFKPYVAGYYAHAILGKELTRAQVLLSLDELLAIGQGKFPQVEAAHA